eukprot:5225233-Pleurochrysis_carterae.AAC.1
MRRRVQVVCVRQTSRIGVRTRSAGRCRSVSETVRDIRGVFRESLQARPPAAKPPVHLRGRSVWPVSDLEHPGYCDGERAIRTGPRDG